MLPAGQTEETGAPNSQNTESRVVDVFGPNFFIETNGILSVGIKPDTSEPFEVGDKFYIDVFSLHLHDVP